MNSWVKDEGLRLGWPPMWMKLMGALTKMGYQFETLPRRTFRAILNSLKDSSLLENHTLESPRGYFLHICFLKVHGTGKLFVLSILGVQFSEFHSFKLAPRRMTSFLLHKMSNTVPHKLGLNKWVKNTCFF